MRRERRKLELRSRMVEAAVGLFDQQGVSATTVAQICERADVAHKTFFNHFPAKVDLLREIAAQALEAFLEDIRGIGEQPGSTRGRLTHLFERIADTTEAAGPMHRELLTEMIHAGHEAGTQSEQQRVLYDAFTSIVRKGREDGDIPARHSLQSQAELVLGAFYVLMFNWAHIEGYPLKRRARAAARLLGDSLCGPSQR
jgi:AcrR family transcriptional regulator